MYTDILRSIVGIHVFPVVSLILFVVVFGVVLVRVVRMDRAGVERLANLPLEEASACGPREDSEVFRAPERERVGVGPHAQ